MGVTKKNMASTASSVKKQREKSVETIVYKSKTSESSFPGKIEKVNKLLSKLLK